MRFGVLSGIYGSLEGERSVLGRVMSCGTWTQQSWSTTSTVLPRGKSSARCVTFSGFLDVCLWTERRGLSTNSGTFSPLPFHPEPQTPPALHTTNQTHLERISCWGALCRHTGIDACVLILCQCTGIDACVLILCQCTGIDSCVLILCQCTGVDACILILCPCTGVDVCVLILSPMPAKERCGHDRWFQPLIWSLHHWEEQVTVERNRALLSGTGHRWVEQVTVECNRSSLSATGHCRVQQNMSECYRLVLPHSSNWWQTDNC